MSTASNRPAMKKPDEVKLSKYCIMGKGRAAKLRTAIVNKLIDADEIPPRREWMELIPYDDPSIAGLAATRWYKENNQWHKLIWSVFASTEMDEMEHEVVRARMARYGKHCINLLERLYQQGMDGDTMAAKEFLNRIMGKPSQQITFQHEVGDSMQRLLEHFSPRGAYQTPQLDENGNEIIEIEAIEEGSSNE